MRFLFGVTIGALLSTGGIGYVFATTTVSYRSTLFEGRSIVIHSRQLSKLMPQFLAVQP